MISVANFYDSYFYDSLIITADLCYNSNCECDDRCNDDIDSKSNNGNSLNDCNSNKKQYRLQKKL